MHAVISMNHGNKQTRLESLAAPHFCTCRLFHRNSNCLHASRQLVVPRSPPKDLEGNGNGNHCNMATAYQGSEQKYQI